MTLKQQQCRFPLLITLTHKGNYSKKNSTSIFSHPATTLVFNGESIFVIYYFLSRLQSDRIDLCSDYNGAEFENVQLTNAYTKLGV
jgi:hypothetical protein